MTQSPNDDSSNEDVEATTPGMAPWVGTGDLDIYSDTVSVNVSTYGTTTRSVSASWGSTRPRSSSA